MIPMARHAAAPACRSTDPELFFPPVYGGMFRMQIAAAKALCGRCPEQSACLSTALDNAEPLGVWGGTTPAERLRLIRSPSARRRVLHERLEAARRVGGGAPR